MPGARPEPDAGCRDPSRGHRVPGNLVTLMAAPAPSPIFTPKQGQYLAFIYAYTQVLGRPPAEADMQRHFKVTPPSVHQMVLTLERAGLIRRTPGVARSIELLGAPIVLSSDKRDAATAGSDERRRCLCSPREATAARPRAEP
jgi:SOS-response transcriptional repressor LexA